MNDHFLSDIEESNHKTSNPFPGMVWIPGGTFTMGSDLHYPEEAPTHKVTVDGFWMDQFTVTNHDFQKFVEETHYVTIAERPLDPNDYPSASPEALVPGSLVFKKTKGRVDMRNIANWWEYRQGANWRNPHGVGSSLEGRWDHPVVHVAWEDVEAYATWAGKELSSEAEWEFAARGGLEGKTYEWGDEHLPGGRTMANFWLGEFPWQSLKPPGLEETSPVGSYPPNGYGLYDMTGNVWEWTQDWYQTQHTHDKNKACCVPKNPRGGLKEGSFDPYQPDILIPRKVLKGGSCLCSANYCYRYRPAARSPQMIDSASMHIGFRCIVRK